MCWSVSFCLRILDGECDRDDQRDEQREREHGGAKSLRQSLHPAANVRDDEVGVKSAHPRST